MKVKEESAKAGQHLNIQKTEIMTTEETHNFHTDNKDTEIVKYFTYLGSMLSSNVD